MTTSTLALGPWALLHSAESMRVLLGDIQLAFACRPAAPIELHGKYAPRDSKPPKRRPLPFSDALLNGAAAEDAEQPKMNSEEDAANWLATVAASPWLWRLQYATIALLVVSPALRNALAQRCPLRVNSLWLETLEDRVLNRLLGISHKTRGSPDSGAAVTPLMMVTSEIILLRTAYEMQ